MTKIKCDMTGCIHNSSCCTSPSSSVSTYCTKEEISLEIDEEMHQLDCKAFEEDFEKDIECMNCQMSKYGGIKINKERICFS